MFCVEVEGTEREGPWSGYLQEAASSVFTNVKVEHLQRAFIMWHLGEINENERKRRGEKRKKGNALVSSCNSLLKRS